MARHDIRGIELPDGTYAMTSRDIYHINDNFIQLSKEIFGNSDFTGKLKKQVDTNTGNIEGILNTVGNLEGDYSQISQEVDAVKITVNSKASTSELQILSDQITTKVTQQQVQDMIEEINRANPNLVSNLEEKWEQGDIGFSDGALATSGLRIRTKGFYPVKQGHVYISVSPLYEARIILYTPNYTHKASYDFANGQTFLLDENCYFKAVLRRANGTSIEPVAIVGGELKVENSQEKTQFTPYYGDLTLAEQTEYFVLDVQSNNGWTVDESDFTATLTAKVLLFNEDVTMRFEAYQFTWYKQYPGGNLISLGNGTAKTITGSSLEKSATIGVRFEIYDTIYLLSTYGGDTILTKSDDTIMIIGDYQ